MVKNGSYVRLPRVECERQEWRGSLGGMGRRVWSFALVFGTGGLSE